MLFILLNFPEPLLLIGEGEYNLNALKEIKVTDSYLGLDQGTRECQIDEPFYNCTTRHFVDTILKECGCLPPNLGHSYQVSLIRPKIDT